MSTAIKSTLNPLADSFIPSRSLKMLNKDGNSTLKKQSKDMPKDLTTDFDSIQFNIIDSSRDLGIKYELSFLEKSMVETIVSRGTLLSNVVKRFITSESTLCRQKSKSAAWQEPSKDPVHIENTTDVMVSSLVKEQCRCPPMFGWVLPPEFFGNPFNLKYDCSKRHAHISHQTEGCRDMEILNSQDKLNNLTLDECYLEVQRILADIFECVSDCPDSIENTQDSLKVTEIPPGIELTHPSMDADSRENFELVDDGCHPLLEIEDEAEEPIADEVKESVTSLEKTLGFVLTPDLIGRRRVCNPPCSVWCDSNLSSSGSTVENKSQQKYLGRPIYKRSLSENDSFKYFPPTDAKDSGKKCDSNTWGPFDSADSLWQPLPDCVPSNEQNFKQNSSRSAKRQKSVN